MGQYRQWCACVTTSVSTFSKLNTSPRLWDLKHGPDADRCSSSRLSVLLKSNVLGSQHQKPKKKPKRHIVTTFNGQSQQKDCVQLKHCHQSCTTRPLIHRCDSRPKPCLVPTEPHSNDSLETFSNERVSHLPCCIEHLCPDIHFVP